MSKELTIEQEIQGLLDSIFAKGNVILEGNYSQQAKDEVKRIVGFSLDYINEQLSESTINQEVYKQVKAKRLEEMKNEV